MDVMVWLAAMGIALILVLAVLAGVSMDTHRHRLMARRVAAERRKLAEERRQFAELRDGPQARHRYQTTHGGWSEPDWDDD